MHNVATERAKEYEAHAWRLRSWLWEHSGNERARACGRVPVGSTVTIEGDGAGRAKYQGLETCGSVWLCPVCAVKVGARRIEELQRLMAWANREGLVVVFLTTTLQHKQGDSLGELKRGITQGWRRLRRSAWWKTVKAAGLVGTVKSVEVTHGSNGWHPHAHSLLFFRRSDSWTRPAIREQVIRGAPSWVRSVQAEGFNALSGPGFDVKIVKELDRPTLEALAMYVSPAKAAGELAWKDRKRAGKGLSWVQLLDAAATGGPEERAIWHEYERTMPGTQSMVMSNGLRKLADIGPAVSDDQAATEANEIVDVEEGELDRQYVVMIGQQLWRHLVRQPGIPYRLLCAARARGPAGVLNLLGELELPPSLAELVTVEEGSPF